MGVDFFEGVFKGIELQFFNYGAIASINRPLHYVLQLTDISWPRIGEKLLLYCLTESDGRLPTTLQGHLVGKVRSQKDDVLPSLTKRRKKEDLKGEAIEKILFELSFGNERRQVSVGRPDDPNIHFMGGRGAHPLIGAVLNNAENLLLDLQGNKTNLIEKECSPLRLFEAALAGLIGSGEGSGFIAEEFGFDQRWWKGCAVDGYQALLPAW